MAWKEILEDHIIQNCDQIKKISKHLKHHFGISFFMRRIYNNGKFVYLTDRSDWVEHYIGNNFFQEDPCLKHPDVFKSGFCFVKSMASDAYINTCYKVAAESFNLNSTLLLIEKTENFVEIFSFSGNRETSIPEKLYLNRPKLLRSFVEYFKNELNPIILQMEENKFSLPLLKETDFYSHIPIDPNLELTSLHSYLSDLGMKSEVMKAKSLSIRERQCLKLLIVGKCAKETAADLRLSPRTIEFYFENIKNKLSCYGKSELFSIAKDFEELGLL